MISLQPTDSQKPVNSEHERWETIFSGEDFYYGHEPGPVARRTVKYHRSLAHAPTPRALDAGCGEGQDALFFSQNGYAVTAVDFTAQGVRKTQNLLQNAGYLAQVFCSDLQEFQAETYDLVLAVNSLQFMGERAESTLIKLKDAVNPNGLIGLSLFARPENGNPIVNSIWRTTLPDLFSIFAGWQFLEATNLWQWNVCTNQPQAFVTLIAQRQT